MSGLINRLYARAMGVRSTRLTPSDADSTGINLVDLAYYAYHKGFWQLIRGLLYRPRLRRCRGRFFLGTRTKILFPNYLSVGRNVALGDYLYLNCYGRQGVSLGDNVRIREFGWIQVTSHLTRPGAGLTIGDDTYIGPHCLLGAAGGITIGRNVTFGAYVQILAENHGFDDPHRPINEQGVERRGIQIGDDCWLGNGAIVLDGVRIGAGAVIGAGSIVTRDVPAAWLAAGNPARPIRPRGTRPSPSDGPDPA